MRIRTQLLAFAAASASCFTFVQRFWRLRFSSPFERAEKAPLCVETFGIDWPVSGRIAGGDAGSGPAGRAAARALPISTSSAVTRP